MPADEQADHDEVADASPKPIPNAVFRDAGRAGMMPDRDFAHAGAASSGDHRHETVHAIEWGDRSQHAAVKHAQVAAGIGEVDAQGQLARPAGNAGRDLADGAIDAFGANPANHIPVAQVGQHRGEIRGVVLDVAVEGGDNCAVAALEAGPESGALSAIAVVAHAARTRVSADAADAFPGLVGTVVVDHDQFHAAGVIADGRENFFCQGEDVFILVEEGDHDGERGMNFRARIINALVGRFHTAGMPTK